MQLDQAHRADAAQAQLAAVHQHQQQTQAFQQWAKTQDDAFMAAHPELADRRAQFDLQQDAVEVLKAQGLSEERLRQLWTSSPEFRSVEAQNLVYAAVKQLRSERTLREMRPTQPPQPMRPGLATQPVNSPPAIAPRTCGGLATHPPRGWPSVPHRKLCWRADQQRKQGADK